MKKLIPMLILALTLTGCSLNVDPAALKEQAINEAKKKVEETLPLKFTDNESASSTTAAGPENNKDNNMTNPLPEIFAANPQVATTTDAELLASYSGAILKTNLGDIKLSFYNDLCPKTVVNFYRLALINYYDGTKFHRVIKDFMIQAGDPNSKNTDWSTHGFGGPGYTFEDEINTKTLVEGSVAMANGGPNTNGSQFFIVTAKATPWLDGKHTNFGTVISGLDIVKKIEAVEVNKNDHPLADITINKVELVK